MKKTTLVLLFIVLFSTISISQTFSVQAYELGKIPNYLDAPTPLGENEYRILLPINFGGSKILNEEVLPMLRQGTIKKINLFYSDFPKNKNFDRLNEKRINNFQRDIKKVSEENIKWTVVKQTECNNKKEALDLFHGFEIILSFPSQLKLSSIQIDSTFKDFVVEKVLKRNNWEDMLIVTDMTGSMSPYIAQLFLWLKLNTIDGRVKQFVFFNDGDMRQNEKKIIGKTGGIYHTKSREYDKVEKMAIRCMMSGSGGDVEENDIEAIINGLQLCSYCKENILIADNNSPVRDLKLLKKIKKPIRVIVCGSGGKVNPEYLNLARHTGGSIHLMEEDLFNLINLNEGETIKIDNTEYIIKENRFIEKTSM